MHGPRLSRRCNLYVTRYLGSLIMHVIVFPFDEGRAINLIVPGVWRRPPSAWKSESTLWDSISLALSCFFSLPFSRAPYLGILNTHLMRIVCQYLYVTHRTHLGAFVRQCLSIAYNRFAKDFSHILKLRPLYFTTFRYLGLNSTHSSFERS